MGFKYFLFQENKNNLACCENWNTVVHHTSGKKKKKKNKSRDSPASLWPTFSLDFKDEWDVFKERKTSQRSQKAFLIEAVLPLTSEHLQS